MAVPTGFTLTGSARRSELLRRPGPRKSGLVGRRAATRWGRARNRPAGLRALNPAADAFEILAFRD